MGEAAPTGAADPARAKTSLGPRQQSSPLPGVIWTVVYSRDTHPSEALPLAYRERAFAVVEPLTDRKLAACLESELARLQRQLSKENAPMALVQLALFDHEFEGEPRRAPLATLSWKQWLGPAEVWVRGLPYRDPTPVGSLRPVSADPAAFDPLEAPLQLVRKRTPTIPPADVPPKPEKPLGARPSGGSPEGPPSVTLPPPTAVVTPSASPPARATSAAEARVPAPLALREATSPGVPEPPMVRPAPQPATISLPAGPPPAAPSLSAPSPGGPDEPPKPTLDAAVHAAAGVRAKTETGHTGRPPGAEGPPSEDALSRLFEAAHSLFFSPDLRSGSAFLVHTLERFLSCEAIVVHVFDINRGQFVVVRAKGPEAEKVLLLRSPGNTARFEQALKRQATQVLDREAIDQDPLWSLLGITPVQLACSPVLQGQRYLGIVEVANPLAAPRFSREDLNALDYISNQFARFVATRALTLDAESILPKE